MNEKKKTQALLKGAAIYGIGTFGTKLLSFFIVPLYTYYISPEDMGVYDILISTISLLSPLITLQISDAAYKSLMREPEETNELYIRATIQVVIVNCLLASLLIFLVDKFFNIPYCGYFVIVLVLSRAQASFHKLLRGLKNQIMFAVSGITYTMFFLTCNVIQICILHMGVISLFQSAVVANIASTICMFLFEKRLRVAFLKKPDFRLIINLLKFSAPLVPNHLNWWVINSSDRYIVALFLGAASNGVLAIAHKFPSLLHTIFGLFTSSWMDSTVAESDGNAGEYYTKVFGLFSRFALSLLWFLIPMTKVVILLIMNVRYKSACNYVAFYYLGMVFQSFSAIYGVGYLRSGTTNKAFSTSIYGAIINAVVNFSLINVIGLHAASISTFAGFLCMWLIREHHNRQELGIQVNWSSIAVYTVLAIGVSLVSNMTSIGINILLSVVGFGVFCVVNRSNIVFIAKFAQKKLGKKQKRIA